MSEKSAGSMLKNLVELVIRKNFQLNLKGLEIGSFFEVGSGASFKKWKNPLGTSTGKNV